MVLRWTGSDSLYLICYPPGIRFRFKCKIFVQRLIIRMFEPFIQSHTVFSEAMRNNLLKFGLKKAINIVPVVLKYNTRFNKIKHEEFNILYYFPKGKKNPKFIEWLYGYDVYTALRDYFGDRFNWIIADGTYDMSKIFPIVDFYIRPNRHDGYGRLPEECKIQDIPYYHTRSNPSIIDARDKIERAIDVKTSKDKT